MNFIWFCVTWVIGIFAGAFLLIQSLIVLFFGIPFTVRLRRLGAMRGRGPLFRYLVSLILLSLLFWATTAGMYAWLPKHMYGYWIGVGLALLSGIGKYSASPANIQDYCDSNAKDIDVEALESAQLRWVLLGSARPSKSERNHDEASQ
jgi:hypothetical protein